MLSELRKNAKYDLNKQYRWETSSKWLSKNGRISRKAKNYGLNTLCRFIESQMKQSKHMLFINNKQFITTDIQDIWDSTSPKNLYSIYE